MEFKNFIKQVKQCKKCKLHKTRKNVVCGKGSNPAELLILNDFPGNIEDLIGFSFAGKSGKLLDKMMLDALRLIKNEKEIDINLPKIYILNTVLCFPTDNFSGDIREPKAEEVENCRENIHKIISYINPKKVLFVGKFAEKKYKKIFPESKRIYKPSFLLQNGGVKSPYYLTNVRKFAEIFYNLNKGVQDESE